MSHKLKPSDHGKILRCEVEHAGFTDRQIIQKRNQYEIDLNLQFKPIGKGNRNVFSNQRLGQFLKISSNGDQIFKNLVKWKQDL